MPGDFTIVDDTHDGYPVKTLRGGGLSAGFAVQLGMIGCSLQHEGTELLGQRRGLAAYEAKGSTMGIPLLHPWANRLSTFEYDAAGRHVVIERDSPLVRLDPNGLPIHGLLAALPYWRIADMNTSDDEAHLGAELDYGAHPELLEAFPFPHVIRIDARLRESALRIETRVTAAAAGPVPISFGFHPYLTLPDVPRADWQIDLPVRRHLLADDRGIPTGETESVDIAPGPLNDRSFDDGYDELSDPPTFVLGGGGRRIELEFLAGYDFAQVFAPPGQELICFEPMTAATNALVAGGPGLNVVEPERPYSAAFEIRVHAD